MSFERDDYMDITPDIQGSPGFTEHELRQIDALHGRYQREHAIRNAKQNTLVIGRIALGLSRVLARTVKDAMWPPIIPPHG